MEECTKHMESKVKPKPSGYWTLELCKEEALNYNSRTKWAKNSSGSYNSSWKKGWLEECAKHMEK